MSFHIKEGTTCGVLGGTGSGKTTIVHLLDRLYELKKGTVQIGGVDIRDIPKKPDTQSCRNGVAGAFFIFQNHSGQYRSC